MIHYSFLGYMIATAIIMIACLFAYRLLLENKVRPSANRLILLAIYVVSFIVPLLSALITETQSKTKIEFGNPVFEGAIGNITGETQVNNFELSDILDGIYLIYFLGVLITFIFSILTIAHLLILLKRSSLKEIGGIGVYVHDNKKLSSFSWGNKIFLYNESLKTQTEGIKMLLSHEKAHLDKDHWIDLALAQIVLIFQWFNPAAWFIRRELQRIHEYEADDAVLKSGISEKEYQMLLIQNISGSRYSGLTDGLNNCSLKKRIIMMKKTKFKKDWVTRGIAVCGFAILGGFIIHIPVVANVLEIKPDSSESSEKTIVIKAKPETSTSEEEALYYIDGEKSEKDNLSSIDPSKIKEIKIDKSGENPKVEITTKETKLPDESTAPVNYNNVSDIKKGEIENYPDAFLAPEKIAEYKGGQEQLIHDLSYLINYPEEAKKEGIQGRVVVRFQINPNGSVSNCEVLRGVNPILDREAVRVVEQTSGNWIAGEVDGKAVASIFNLPVTFKISGQESK